VNDFLIDVAQWSEIEVGVYIKLLCYQWRNGHLLNDFERLRAVTSLGIVDFKRAWKFVSKKFIKSEDGHIRNRRLEEVRKEQIIKMKKGEKKSRNAALALWDGPNLPDCLNTKTFLESWNKWKDYKKQMHRFKYKTQMSEQAAIDKLARECDSNSRTAELMIENSIAKQYMGIYPIKKETKQQIIGRKDFSE
jgi:uncharacterized protein YdaU (DUF1376 family)